MNKNKISKRIQEIITTATPKQKALLVCKEWSDKNATNKTPTITKEEQEAIIESITDPEEAKEYNKWINAYNVYNDLVQYTGLVYSEYRVQAEKVLGYLREWEAYDNEENHLIAIYEELKTTGSDEAIKAYYTAIKHLSFPNAKIGVAEDGYVEIDIDYLYQKIQGEIENLTFIYCRVKSYVEAFDEFVKRTRSKTFIPPILANAIDDIKSDYALKVAPRYSRENLAAKKAKGVKITPDEEKRAVYPSYEEIQADGDTLEFMRRKINNIAKEYGYGKRK